MLIIYTSFKVVQPGIKDQHVEKKMPIDFQGLDSKAKFIVSHTGKTLLAKKQTELQTSESYSLTQMISWMKGS
jgi:hypothetical protein